MKRLIKSIYLLPLFILISFFILTPEVFAANRYWVGGGSSANWNATGPTNWGSASNTQDNASVPGASDDVFFDGVGTGASNSTLSASITINSLDMTGYTNTLTHNAAVGLTVDGNGVVFKLASGMTYTLGNDATSAIGFSGASGTTLITTAGKTVGNVTFIGNGTFQLQDALTSTGTTFQRSFGTFDPNGQTVTLTSAGTVNIIGTLTFYNLTRTGTAVTTSVLNLGTGTGPTVTNNLTLAGNSSTNRLLVQSSVLGTTRTITNTGATMTWSNVDFRDIALSTSYDCSAISGLCGDAGGNSGITFTTAQTNYWIGDTGSWSDPTQWSTSSGGAANGRTPLPQDSAVFDNGSFSGTSQTVTGDMPRIGKNIDWSAYSEGQTPTWSFSASHTLYGSLTLVSGMNFTANGQSTTFEGRGSFDLNLAGKTPSFITIQMIGGTLTLQANAQISNQITLSNGTFNANNFNYTALSFSMTGSNTRALNMGNGTWTMTSTGTKWNATTVTGLTFNANGSTIIISDTTATAKTFTGGGLTYNNVTFSGDNITVTGNNTFNTLAVNNAGLANGLKLTSGTTQTITSLTTNGSSGNLAILAATPSGIATLSKSSGTVSVDYMSIASSTATGGATWYAGANSTNVGNNTGWTFSAAPSVPTILTAEALSVTLTTATASSTITATGGATVTNRGFAYGTDSTLATVISTTTETGSHSTGPFSSSLSSLTCGTTYYIRAYAVNSAGTTTSTISNFTTSSCISAPTVSTDTTSSLSTTGATLNGTISSTGNEDATEHGFAYGTSADLSTVIATTTLGAKSGTGSFASDISALTCATTYYVRAYATNTGGTGYGSIVSFTTSACPVSSSSSSGSSGSRRIQNVVVQQVTIPTQPTISIQPIIQSPTVIPIKPQTQIPIDSNIIVDIIKPLSNITSLLKNFAIATFTHEDKQKLPSEVVFAKPANLPSYDIVSQVNIHVPQGKQIDLAVKVDKPVKEIIGYLTIKKIDRATALNYLQNQKTNLLMAAVGASVENKFVLETFKYTDTDNDGIYTATIAAPKVRGEYDIMTILEYKDTKLGYRELHMTAVIDPEGYIYKKSGNLEARIPDALVSILWKNPQTSTFEPWPADKYEQVNPQKTDTTGMYSFLVPEGTYKLTVNAPGYHDHIGQEFQVLQGAGVHENIELKAKTFWSGVLKWVGGLF